MTVRVQWVTERRRLGGLVERLAAAECGVLGRSQFEFAPGESEELAIDDRLFGVVEFRASAAHLLHLLGDAVDHAHARQVIVVDLGAGRPRVRELAATGPAGGGAVVVKSRAASRRFPHERKEQALRLVGALLRRHHPNERRDAFARLPFPGPPHPDPPPPAGAPS